MLQITPASKFPVFSASFSLKYGSLRSNYFVWDSARGVFLCSAEVNPRPSAARCRVGFERRCEPFRSILYLHPCDFYCLTHQPQTALWAENKNDCFWIQIICLCAQLCLFLSLRAPALSATSVTHAHKHTHTQSHANTCTYSKLLRRGSRRARSSVTLCRGQGAFAYPWRSENINKPLSGHISVTE